MANLQGEECELLEGLLGNRLINGKHEHVPTDSLTGKVIGLYFGAKWCPPCNDFTPKLAAYYKNLKANGVPLEIVFISLDTHNYFFVEYFKHMPWLAVSFDDSVTKERLKQRFNVTGIPRLVFLEGLSLEVIAENARSNVEADPEGRDFPYRY